jgi:hypothetical protein
MGGNVTVFIPFPDFPCFDIPAGFDAKLGDGRACINLNNLTGDSVTLEGFLYFSGPESIIRLPDFFFRDIIQNFDRR